MDTTSIQLAFNGAAPRYDQTRRQLIPCFDELYSTVLALIPYAPQDRFRVLDLGAGTGLLSLFITEHFPNARLTLMDISEAMLAKAKERFSATPEQFDFVTADYSEELHGEFDVVVSALSIHHLSDALKSRLFHRIHEVLPKGGMFINADQVLGASPKVEKIYRENWIAQVRKNGVSTTDLNAALERMKEDKMATLRSQMQWLTDAGFANVNCWYKNYSFAVYSGTKELTFKGQIRTPH